MCISAKMPHQESLDVLQSDGRFLFLCIPNVHITWEGGGNVNEIKATASVYISIPDLILETLREI